MARKKVFLITSFDLKYPFGGGAIVRDILAELGQRFDLAWAYLDTGDKLPPLEAWIDEKVEKIPYKLPKKRRFLFTAIDYRVYYADMPLLARKIKARLKKGDIIWVILENTTISLAAALAGITDNPLHVSVHDDCRGFYSPYRFIGDDEAIASVFRRAASADFIGYNLLKEYQSFFPVKQGLVFRRGMEAQGVEIKKPAAKPAYKLLFVGSSHSAECWRMLIDKLQLLNARFDILLLGNTAYIHQLGLDIAALGNISFIEGGMVNDAEIAGISEGCDFGVFFWDFMPDDRLKFSVSTKFTTYGRLGLPMLALMSPLCELYDLFERRLALDIRHISQDAFDGWVSRFPPEAYKTYLSEFFDKDKMTRALLAADAFAP